MKRLLQIETNLRASSLWVSREIYFGYELRAAVARERACSQARLRLTEKHAVLEITYKTINEFKVA